MKKIFYLTGTRADYGLMKSVLSAIDEDKKLDLQIYATGMHLMPKFGYSYNLVKKDFSKTKKIDAVFTDDDRTAVTNFISQNVAAIGQELAKNKFDYVLLLGDRPEMLATAIAATYLRIPIIHFHGGERSGTVDDAVRHAISQFAHLHLVATPESAQRLKKMGEESWRIKIVGAPSLDSILNSKLLTKKKLYELLDFDLDQKYILVTLHPVTDEQEKSGWQMRQVLSAVKQIGCQVVIIYPNADVGSSQMIDEIKKEENNPRFRIYRNLNYQIFLSIIKYCQVWVGNSSAGLIESATFKVPVVNVGSRQKLRQRDLNVTDCDYDQQKIVEKIEMCQRTKVVVQKIWGDGHTAEKTLKILKQDWDIKKLLDKKITY